MRVSTAFNRMLGIPGAWVESVAFEAEGIVVGLSLRARQLRCPCGYSTRARYDSSRRRWRHVDLGASRLWLEADIRRLVCRRCDAVRTEEVPWARPGARHSRDFQEVVAWLTQRMDKSAVASLMRCSWEAVHRIVGEVVAERLDDARLEGVYHLGVDEISYKRGHYYLTVVADHDRGRVVWAAPGKHTTALGAFYEALGPQGRDRIQAVSMDLGSAYREVTRAMVPQAVICFDPFHVIRMANRALDAVYMASRHGADGTLSGRQWRTARYALRAGIERLGYHHRQLLNQFRRSRYRLWRAWELKEDLRDLYRYVPADQARAYLRRWLAAASRSRIPAFVNLARRLRIYFDGVIAAVELGLSNSRLEGINAKIRLIQRRGYGHRCVKSLAAMIYLCIGGIVIDLPGR